MAYCIKESDQAGTFLEITRAPSYSFYANDRSFSCANHNAFLQMMDGALTGKTGFTNKAGYCYVGALERDGRTFVVALLACGWPNNKSYKWSDTKELMQYGIDNYFYRSFAEEGTAFEEGRLKPIPVAEGQTKKLGDQAYVDVKIADRQNSREGGAGKEGGSESGSPGNGKTASASVYGEAQGGGSGEWVEGLLLKEGEEIRVEHKIKGSLTAPVAAGTTVGWIDYVVDGTIYKRELIVTARDVEQIDSRWCIQQIFRRFLLF